MPATSHPWQGMTTWKSTTQYYTFVLMYSISERMHPRITAQCPRYVIPGKDQGPYIHVLYSAD